MTRDIDYAAVVPAPVGLVGVLMRSDQLLAIDRNADLGIVDFYHQRAVSADDADHGAGHVGQAGRFRQAESAERDE